MSSFACPHLNGKEHDCLRTNKPCIPGRQGCVLSGKYQFKVPVEHRIAENENKLSEKKNTVSPKE
ncbi:MAG: hypothetical protein WCJ01_01155 [Ignavibacteria bacterium]